MPASRFGLDWREMERESGMKRGKSGRIVFSGYLDTDGARKGGWAVGRAEEHEEGNDYWRRWCFGNTFCKGREDDEAD